MKAKVIAFKIKRYIIAKYGKVNPVAVTKYYYKQRIGHNLNLDNPKALTEKLHWLKLFKYRNNPLVTKCADKYKVREFIKEKGCSEILNDLYGSWDSPNDIDWDQLPNKFVLKCNHGCGYNIVCKDKNNLNIEKTNKLLRKWLNEKYGSNDCELIYDNIVPKIICEKFIETENDGNLLDYKIFCSYGEPKLIYVITGGHGSRECVDYYTPNWEWIPVNNGTLPNAGDIVEKPKTLNLMLNYARKLSKDFPIVRVDLYSEFGNIIFGELTFLATGGMSIYNPKEYDFIFGDLFPLELNGDEIEKK